MEKKEKINFIYADPDRTTETGVIPLDTYGTTLDLERYGMKFEEEKRYWFWRDDGDAQGNDDPLLFSGIVHFDGERNKWVAVTDKESWQHYSESEFKKDYTIEDIVKPVKKD